MRVQRKLQWVVWPHQTRDAPAIIYSARLRLSDAFGQPGAQLGYVKSVVGRPDRMFSTVPHRVSRAEADDDCVGARAAPVVRGMTNSPRL
jgi:hypothetical protein